MSERIEYQAFDGAPFGFSFGNRRVTDGPGAFGPRDPVEDNRLGLCRFCEQWVGLNRDGTCADHLDLTDMPCRGYRWTPKETDRA